MDDSLCYHEKVDIILRAGRVIRKEKGLPPENNVTKLYEETCKEIGVPVGAKRNTSNGNVPPPIALHSEFKDIIPKKPCPKCGQVMMLQSICPACKDSEKDGKKGFYNSGYLCSGCGFIDEKSEMVYGQRLESMGIEVPTGLKERLGIKTITDQGSR